MNGDLPWRLKEEMKRAIDAEDLSKLATLHQQIERVQPTESKCRVLDLTSGLFARLTDAGFAEIAALCPDVTAVFLSSDTRVTSAGLDAFREQCPGVRCLALGGEVMRETFMVLLRQYEQPGSHSYDACTLIVICFLCCCCASCAAPTT